MLATDSPRRDVACNVSTGGRGIICSIYNWILYNLNLIGFFHIITPLDDQDG